MNTCEKCMGRRYLPIVRKDSFGYETEYFIPCRCLVDEKYLRKLGPKLFNQRSLKKSQLSEFIDENLFIQGSEQKFLPHLKHVLIAQGLDFKFMLLNDSQLLRIYLGDDPELKDLDSWQKPFLVFFMGHVGYKNKALPGIIFELLNLRLFKGYKTWVHYPDKFWGSGCIEFSDEVDDLRKNFFKFVDFRSPVTKTATQNQCEKRNLDEHLLNGFNS